MIAPLRVLLHPLIPLVVVGVLAALYLHAYNRAQDMAVATGHAPVGYQSDLAAFLALTLMGMVFAGAGVLAAHRFWDTQRGYLVYVGVAIAMIATIMCLV